MTSNDTTSQSFPPFLPAQSGEFDLDVMPIYTPGSDPHIEDVIVYGPVLLKDKDGRPWSIGMQGYRWSKSNGGKGTGVPSADEATRFAQASIRSIRQKTYYSPEILESAELAETAMDVDVQVPTLLVVVSPSPSLEFDELVPISAKIKYSSGKFGVLDPNCMPNQKSRYPKLWSFTDRVNSPTEWKTPGNHILTWFNSYKEGESEKGLQEHNFHMVLKSVAFDTNGGMFHVGRPLPIIFDPGNNNGGAGGKP